MIFHAVVIVLSTGIRGNDNRKVTLLIQCKEAAVVAYRHSWFLLQKEFSVLGQLYILYTLIKRDGKHTEFLGGLCVHALKTLKYMVAVIHVTPTTYHT